MDTDEYLQLLDHMDNSIYVIEKNTYKLLFVNSHAVKKNDDREYRGKYCYNYFNGLQSPCPWCSMSKMRDGRVHIDENYVPPLKKWFKHDAVDIKWNGCEAAAFYLVDITSEMVQRHRLEIEKQRLDTVYHTMSKVNPEALATFQLNITKDKCIEGQSLFNGDMHSTETMTVRRFLDTCAKTITDDSIREAFSARFTKEMLLSEFQNGNSEISTEYPASDKHGGTLWVKGFILMAQNPSTGDVEAVAYALDITKRKLMERIVLCITEEEYDFIAVINVREKKIHFVEMKDDAKETTLHFTSDFEEDISTAFKKLLGKEQAKEHSKAVMLDVVEKRLHDEDAYTHQFDVRNGRGETLRKQLKFKWLDDKKEMVLLTRRDITAEYQQEQAHLLQLQEALDTAEQANRSKTDFVSRISHDIRTPISAISSMTAFAKEDIDDRERLEDDLKKIEASNKFLLSLINDVLDISRIDSGKTTLVPEPYTYSEYTEDIRNILVPMCVEKGLNYRIERSRETKGIIIADKVRLRQITLNLLSNAVKYTPAGGTITYRSVSEDIPGADFHFGFEIEDTGIGMSNEFQKIMFDRFTQEDENPYREKNATGTGLGLYIVKKLVDLMGGNMIVESRQGSGTRIRCDFIFPDASKDPKYDEMLSDFLSKNEGDRESLSGRVLLAEDNAINTQIAVRILESMGLQVECAENGKEAVEMFERSLPGQYNVVLMDIRMPVMDGYEAVKAIRHLDRRDAASVPVIAMTADAFEGDVKKCIDAGMNAHMSKPVDAEALYILLKKIM